MSRSSAVLEQSQRSPCGGLGQSGMKYSMICYSTIDVIMLPIHRLPRTSEQPQSPPGHRGRFRQAYPGDLFVVPITSQMSTRILRLADGSSLSLMFHAVRKKGNLHGGNRETTWRSRKDTRRKLSSRMPNPCVESYLRRWLRLLMDTMLAAARPSSSASSHAALDRGALAARTTESSKRSRCKIQTMRTPPWSTSSATVLQGLLLRRDFAGNWSTRPAGD